MIDPSDAGDADNDLDSSIVLSELKSRNSYAFDRIMQEHEEQRRKEAEERRKIRQRLRSKQCSELQLRHKQTIPSNAVGSSKGIKKDRTQSPPSKGLANAKTEARPKTESLKSRETTTTNV